ncbi:MAG: prephenate dehydrogenase/arogenate dehydrogenase family protein [Gammaproteobacteria bacterium]|nr:prephenate dehydrogenase/arogenate dehydrogenase family protein [Gammaproteobacteria bacterium]
MAVIRISILGVGLIGGSFARSLKRTATATDSFEITGYGRRRELLDRALELGVIDRGETDLARAVAAADVVVLGVPVGAVAELLRQLRPLLTPEMVITDVGSTKGSVVAAAEEVFGAIPPRFIPGHPIAGTEKSGVEAALDDLFVQRRVILTPVEGSDPHALTTVRQLWQQCGAEVVEMSVRQHDEVLAATSHLPHMLAYTLVDTLSRMEEHDDIFRFAAGGFRDFTRIASSNPRMWHDICLNNRAALLKTLEQFGTELERLQEAIRVGDSDVLLRTFTEAKQARDRYATKESSGDE